MRPDLKTLLFLVLLAFLGGGCASRPIAAPTVEGVREVENGWNHAFVHGDSAYLEALLDPEYVSVGAKGNARPKAEIVALAAKFAQEHPGEVDSPLPPTSTIRIQGNAAVVTHHGKDNVSVDVFYFAEGRWHAWYSQHTSIAPAP
jgi:hypothetical protein